MYMVLCILYVKNIFYYRGLDESGIQCVDLHNISHQGGLSTSQHQKRLTQYGPNSVDVPVKPYHVLLIEEVLHPFYIFQVHVVSSLYLHVHIYFLLSLSLFLLFLYKLSSVLI